MPSLAQTLQVALEHHQHGELSRAEELYRQVLRTDPRCADALHLLGVAAQQRGNFSSAIDLISRAIEANAGEAAYHNNLGAAYRADGNLTGAAGCFERAVRLMPEYEDALSNLADLHIALGRGVEALATCQRLLSISPDSAAAHRQLGDAYRSMGSLDDAQNSYRRAIEIDAECTEAITGLEAIQQQRPTELQVPSPANAGDPLQPNTNPIDPRAMSSSSAQPEDSLSDRLCSATCPACGHHVAIGMYDGGRQPLATLAWPRSADEAEHMPKLPLSFVRCVDCGHVFNSEFDYAQVPYSDKPNLMFNKGAIWSEHLGHVCELIAQSLAQNPTVVEIGCGEGHLLRALAQLRPDGRFIGFDPNSAIEPGGTGLEARAMLFDPAIHLAECRPDLIISRHVLEHLMNPLGFVQALSFAASWENIKTRLFIEVPCIDHVLETGRTVDFYYEHNSHFTVRSLKRLMSRCAADVEVIETSYNGEVVYGLASFCRQPEQIEVARAALDFRDRSIVAEQNLRGQVAQLHESSRRVAIWGGTGKASALINQIGLDRERFPIVVDSDPDKAGTHVPGTGQVIHHRDFLKEQPVEVILIATQWRAADIVLEIEENQIPFETILIEHQGKLIDYFADPHPYKPNQADSTIRPPKFATHNWVRSSQP